MDSFTLAGITAASIEQALHIHRTYRFSYYDSLIIASALESGCTILYTEDLQDEQLIEENLVVKNPFKQPTIKG